MFLTWMYGDKTRGNRHKLLHGKFHLSIRNNSALGRSVKQVGQRSSGIFLVGNTQELA